MEIILAFVLKTMHLLNGGIDRFLFGLHGSLVIGQMVAQEHNYLYFGFSAFLGILVILYHFNFLFLR